MKTIALILATFVTDSNAQTWTGAISGDWNNSLNWDSGVPIGSLTTAIHFDNAVQTTTNNSITGLVVNSLTFGENSGVRTTSGNAITFDGTAPTLRLRNAAGTGIPSFNIPIVLNQTLQIEGGPTYANQVSLSSTAVISGTGGVRIVGGITTFGAKNTYSGETILESGGLGVYQTASLGNSPSVTIQSGASMQLLGAGNIDKPLTVGGEGDTAFFGVGYAMAAAGNGSKQWIGSVTLSDNATFMAYGGSTLKLAGTAGLSLNGHDLTLKTLSNSLDSVSISKTVSGNGNLIIDASPLAAGAELSGINTFVGGTFITSGKLSINTDGNFGANGNPVTIDGGTLSSTNGITIPSTRPIIIGENGATFRGGDQYTTSKTIVLATPLGGENPIYIANRVALNSSNNFSGDITVDPAGTLIPQTDSSLGATTSQINLNGDATAIAKIILPADFNVARKIAITGTRGLIDTTAPVTFTNAITGPGELIFSFSGNPVILTVANTHEGGTTLESGTVKIHDDSALGPVTAPLTCTSQGRLGATQNLTIPAARPIRMRGGGFDTTGVEIHVPGDIEILSGGSLSISGSGTFRFDGTMTGSTYAKEGSTTAGTGTFDGFFNADEPVTLAPGGATTTGTLTVGQVRMSDGKLRVRLSSSASDKLVVTTGNINLSAKLYIDVVGPIAANDTFTIIQNQGTGSTSVSLYSPTDEYLGSGNLPFVQDGITWSINYNGGTGKDVVLTALTASAAAPPVPKITGLVITPGTSNDPASPDHFPTFSGTITNGVPNSNVILESSTDLGLADDWSTVETILLNASGTATFTNLSVDEPAALQHNFFRLKIP